jgi:GT2 family glycosyltransferase
MTAFETVSVIIPTFGEGRHLRDVLLALGHQSRPPAEVLVVDNNISQVHAAEAVSAACPLARVLHEPRNGLQHGRNTGVSGSAGAIIAFLDDDAVPCATWLDALVAGMGQYGASMAGGTVRLAFRNARPAWLGRTESALLSELLYDGRDIARLGEDRYIVGANMSVRKSVLEQNGWFDAELDRTATSLRSSGELEYMRRLQVRGHRISFIAAAVVDHQIESTRLTKSYFLKRSYWQGRSDALLESRWPRPAGLGERNFWKNTAQIAQRAFGIAAAGTREKRLHHLFALVREWGYLAQGLAGNRSR